MNQQIRNKICLVALFSSHWDMGKLCKGLFLDALHQILINFTKQFQPIRNKNYLWQPCLVSDQDKIRKLYKGTSTDAKVKKLIHLGKEFQRRRLLNVSTNQKQESSMATIFLSDPVNMRKLHKTHSIDAPNQILIH